MCGSTIPAPPANIAFGTQETYSDFQHVLEQPGPESTAEIKKVKCNKQYTVHMQLNWHCIIVYLCLYFMIHLEL